MAEAARDLWPDDFGPIDESSVGTFLREQAAQLSRKTNHFVEAEVNADFDTSSGEDWLVYRFFLTAPKLDNYRYLLFKARHNVPDAYPLEVVHEGESELCESQKQLADTLRQIFSAESTKNVIKTLIRESQQK